MGTISFLLACIVVVSHIRVGSQFGVGNVLAVKAFFVISGYYMTMILCERYKRATDFYVSRALRLYPLYLVTLGIGVCCVIALGKNYVLDFLNLQVPIRMLTGTVVDKALGVFVVLSNLLIVGTDASSYTCYQQGGIVTLVD